MPAACRRRPPATSGRSPTCPTRAPASGAMTNSVAVHGSSRRPASNGPSPCAICRNWAMKKTLPKIEPNRQKPAALPAANARVRKSRGGSIGSAARRSRATKAGGTATPGGGAAPTPGDEGGEQRNAGGERADDLGAGPAGGVAAHEPPHEAERGAGDEREA